MSNGTITRAEGERAVRAVERLRDDASERKDRQKLVMGFAGARVGTRVLSTMIPSLAGMAPIAEIGGGAYLIMKGMDPKEKDSGLKLGMGLGLGVGVVDRIGDFVVNAAAKFKNGK